MKRRTTKASEAASLMGRRSVKARIEQWGPAEFRRRMQEWGKLGGRPKQPKPHNLKQAGKQRGEQGT